MGTLTWGCGGPSQETSTRPGRILGRRSRWKYHRRFQKIMGWAAGSSGNANTSLPSFSTSDSSSFRSTRGLRYAHAPLSTRRGAPCQAHSRWTCTVGPFSELAPLSHSVQYHPGCPCLSMPTFGPCSSPRRATYSHASCHHNSALTAMCPLQSWGSSRARQSLRSLSTGPGPPGTGASLLPVGAGLGLEAL